MEDIINAISTLGFPIACAVAAFYVYAKFVSKQMDACTKREEQLLKQSEVREEKLAGQLDKFSDTLNNFNITLTKIDARLDAIEKEVRKDL